jgi:hypothetical protein
MVVSAPAPFLRVETAHTSTDYDTADASPQRPQALEAIYGRDSIRDAGVEPARGRIDDLHACLRVVSEMCLSACIASDDRTFIKSTGYITVCSWFHVNTTALLSRSSQIIQRYRQRRRPACCGPGHSWEGELRSYGQRVSRIFLTLSDSPTRIPRPVQSQGSCSILTYSPRAAPQGTLLSSPLWRAGED